MSNSYTIEKSDINYSGGRYLSTNPYNAAKKAANQLFRKIKNEKKYNKFKSSKTLKFTLRETTSSSNKKEFTYKASQVKLDKPIKVIIKGKEIIYKFRIDITSMNMSTKKGGACPESSSTIPDMRKINGIYSFECETPPCAVNDALTTSIQQGGGCGSGTCSLP
jgi:hypothetical protein